MFYFNRNIKIDCYDSRINGNHKLIGTCYTTLRRLTSKDEPPMNLVNEELQKTNPEHTTAGILKVVKISIDEDVTFLGMVVISVQQIIFLWLHLFGHSFMKFVLQFNWPTLSFHKITHNTVFLLPDYIRNGTQMHFAVAIDFTASNGRHSHPSSLHYLSPERQNFYEIAIRAVGEIVQHYNSSQLFPAFGMLLFRLIYFSSHFLTE